jgi:hypothetical protein
MEYQSFLRQMRGSTKDPGVYILSNAEVDATVSAVGEASGKARGEGKNGRNNPRVRGSIASKMQEENWLRRKIQEEIDRKLLEKRIVLLEEKVRYLSGFLL